jgi:hypothetical protein
MILDPKPFRTLNENVSGTNVNRGLNIPRQTANLPRESSRAIKHQFGPRETETQVVDSYWMQTIRVRDDECIAARHGRHARKVALLGLDCG